MSYRFNRLGATLLLVLTISTCNLPASTGDLGGATSHPPPVTAATLPPDIATGFDAIRLPQACRFQYPKAIDARLVRGDAYGWKCVGADGQVIGGTGGDDGLDLTAWCNHLAPGAIAVAGSMDEPGSWRCSLNGAPSEGSA